MLTPATGTHVKWDSSFIVSFSFISHLKP